MGHRFRGIFAIAVAALAVTTACSEGNGGNGGGSSTEDSATTIASADEVIKIVDKGFTSDTVTQSTGTLRGYVSFGFVIENVSDEVAVTVRVEVSFTDEAGKPVPRGLSGHDFSVVLPGQRIGAGDGYSYDGPAAANMDVRITLIAALDSMDGERHRKPPAPYAELETGNPVPDPERETITLDVTNTYDVPLSPMATAVVRDAGGAIVGGENQVVAEQIPPGGTAQAELNWGTHLSGRPEGDIEYYADPMLGRVITRTPVWQDV